MEKQKNSNDYKIREWLENSINMAVDAVKNANANTIDYKLAKADLKSLREIKYAYQKIFGDFNDN